MVRRANQPTALSFVQRHTSLVCLLSFVLLPACEDAKTKHVNKRPRNAKADEPTRQAVDLERALESNAPAGIKVAELKKEAGAPPPVAPSNAGRSQRPCPPEMVNIAGEFCIDRYEASIFDKESRRELSPYYPPVREKIERFFETWLHKTKDGTTSEARALAVPVPPAFSLVEEVQPMARSLSGVTPSAYHSRRTAALSCENAGKRLCSHAEWVRACRGEEDRDYPYGDSYEDGTCNVHRLDHPAALLHGDASINHLDPRLNLVRGQDGPLLRQTGDTPACVSRWEDDAIHDMVGNLDEWVDDPAGVFVGGFYSRDTKSGCGASVSAHGPLYRDYSLGVRCCSETAPVSP